MKNSVNDRIGLPRKTAEKLLRGDLVSRLKQHQSWLPTSRHIHNALTTWPGLIEETAVKKSLWLALSYAVPKLLKENASNPAREGNASNIGELGKIIYGAWGRILNLAADGTHVLTNPQVRTPELMWNSVFNSSRNTKQCSGCKNGELKACHSRYLNLIGRCGRATSPRLQHKLRAEAIATSATDERCGALSAREIFVW